MHLLSSPYSHTRLLNEDSLGRYRVKVSIPPVKATCLNLLVSVAGSSRCRRERDALIRQIKRLTKQKYGISFV